MDEITPAAPKKQSRLFRVLRAGVIAYLAALIFLMLFENKLVYPAPEYDAELWDRCREQFDVEEILLETSDQRPATAWLFEPTILPDTQRFVIFFHGNGENIAYNSDFLRRFADEMQTNILACEYPGYDRHDTKANEQSICNAAEAGMQWMCERYKIQPNEVIVMGRSLSGGPAMYLAEDSKSRAIILLSTFSSLPDVAAEKYTIFPVKLVMRNRFPSLERMKTCKQPLLQFHGDMDNVIPMKFARKLFLASPSNAKRFVELEGRGHNYDCPKMFWTEVRSFLESL